MHRQMGWVLGLIIIAAATCGCWRAADQVTAPASPTITEKATAGSTTTPSPTATSTSTPSPTPTPTPTPAPAELLSSAQQALHDGDYESAAETYTVLLTRSLDDETSVRSLFGLGRAHLHDQGYPEAIDVFQEILTEHGDGDQAHDATFLLGDALAGAGEPLSATQAYSSYLQAGTVITPYVNLSLGDAFRAAGAHAAALAPYERALAEAPDRVFRADVREKLAQSYAALEEYAAAVEQYDAILTIARHPPYRARIEHQAAETLLLAGAIEAGYQRHAHVVETYPTEEHAYRSLVKLVQAGRPVDDLLRGQVDYYGEAYGPAVEALYRYIYAYPENHSGDAHWYAGLSYWEAGSLSLAINEFELLIDTHPYNRFWGRAWLKLAEVYADRGQTEEAISTYRGFVDAAPDHALAPEALWEAAQLLERAGMIERAAASYLDCERAYPSSEFAATALYRRGLQLYQLEDLAEAARAWEALTEQYPGTSYRSAALLWLGKVRLEKGEVGAARTALQAAVETAPDEYYGLRAIQLASSSSPTPSPYPDYETQRETDGRDEAETWLADWLELESPDGIGKLSPRLAADGRLQRGRELWRLDRFQQAKTELEALRSETYSNPLDQYQLALAYSELGLYRSSILCAWRVIDLSPVTSTLDAPDFLLRLAYPTYYENLVRENVQKTGLDPHLIFSLIRQESLFESLATSGASAHGLMQVIPPTGAEIANELGWPPGYATADLYHPHVSLRFGTYYLAKQRDRFGGRIDVALAAYNGGPFNAQRWLERSADDRDLFLEKITFSETRLYVKRVQEHLAIYQALYTDLP